jgi:hypothetical protein
MACVAASPARSRATVDTSGGRRQRISSRRADLTRSHIRERLADAVRRRQRAQMSIQRRQPTNLSNAQSQVCASRPATVICARCRVDVSRSHERLGLSASVVSSMSFERDRNARALRPPAPPVRVLPPPEPPLRCQSSEFPYHTVVRRTRRRHSPATHEPDAARATPSPLGNQRRCSSSSFTCRCPLSSPPLARVTAAPLMLAFSHALDASRVSARRQPTAFSAHRRRHRATRRAATLAADVVWREHERRVAAPTFNNLSPYTRPPPN